MNNTLTDSNRIATRTPPDFVEALGALSEKQIADCVRNSIALVAALVPLIGFARASRIAYNAIDDGTTLRHAALETGWIDERTFDQIMGRTMAAFC